MYNYISLGMMNILKYFILGIVVISQSNSYCQKYNSLSWKITGKKCNSPSYLYGTMHVQDERVFQFKTSVQEAFDNADVLALELNMDSVNPLTLMQELIMDSNKVLSDFYTSEQYDSIATFFKDSLGLNVELFEHLAPFFLEQMISSKDLQENKEDALDMYFFKTAKKNGKKIVGLETMEEQINTLKSIPLNTQAKSLLNAVRNQGTEDNFDMKKIMKWYTDGNLDSLATITDIYFAEDKKEQKEFNDNFLDSRNKTMVKRMIQYLKNGNAFIAVGAAHLPGENGIIELLRRKGYTVEPL